MKVVMSTYKSIGWIVKACAHMYEKYWDISVVLLAERDYSDGQFEFVRPPLEEMIRWDDDADIAGEIPGRYFTDVLIWYLRQIEDEHIILMLSDYLLTAPVDTKLIKHLQEYMELNSNVLRGHIDYGGGFYNGQKTDTYKDIEIWEGSFFPASLCPAIWSRKLLLEMMNHRNTSWGFETGGKDKFPWNGCRSIAAKPGMVEYINCIRARDMSYMVMTHAVYIEVAQYLKIKTCTFID